MLLYPADVGAAFVAYYRETHDRRFLDAARGIGKTYLKTRRSDGSWPLKMRLATAEPIGENTLVPTKPLAFFTALAEATGDSRWADAADGCFAWLEAHPLADWNWDGQFEDVQPRPPYANPTKHNAIDAMLEILRRFPGDPDRIAQCRRILRFCEKRFVCWEKPANHPKWDTPSVLEQYSCFIPIDASAAKMIRAYLALWRATGEPELLAKARALGDTITRVQTPEGRIPTFWTHDGLGEPLYDWLNCMESSAAALFELDDAIAASSQGPAHDAAMIPGPVPGVPPRGASGLCGVCAHLHRVASAAERAEECARIASAGISRVRFDFEWRRIQKTPGAPFDFSHYDAVVADAEACGLVALPIIHDVPKWADPVWEYLDAWRAFVGAVVAHYGGRFPEIEIWNEENHHTFWKHEPSPERYLETLRAAYEAAKAADPRVRVLFGGTAGTDLKFIGKVCELGGAPFFDVVNIHPYSLPYRPEGNLDAKLDALRALMAEYGDAEKPVVVTEIGWATHEAVLPGLEWVAKGLAAARPAQKSWRTVYAATHPGPDGGLPVETAAAIERTLPPGSSCEACFGARLRERLAAGDVDAVIYPFDETFPADTFKEVLDFVDGGGVLVDCGGMPLWFAASETEPGVSVIGGDAESRTGVSPGRCREALGIDATAWWMDPAFPKAETGGADRFQTPRMLGPGDEFVPLLSVKRADGGDAVAVSVVRRSGGRRGCVVVSGIRARGQTATTSEAAQARYLVRAAAIAAAKGVDEFFWYEFRGRETDPDFSEHHFGLTHKDFSPKPAFFAYRTFIAMRPAGSVQTPGPWRDEASGFFFPQWTRPDGTASGVLWKTGDPETHALRFDSEAVRFFDLLGRPVAPSRTSSGAFTLAISESPVFFEGGALR